MIWQAGEVRKNKRVPCRYCSLLTFLCLQIRSCSFAPRLLVRLQRSCDAASGSQLMALRS